MTLKYEISDDMQELKVFDHNGNLIKTVQNDGKGFNIPQDIKDIVFDEAEKVQSNGNIQKWRELHLRLASDKIKEKGE
jgi:hypothetical protein